MSSNTILKTANYVRLNNIRKFESMSEEYYDIQPIQFNNTIRWNIGHFITIMDSMLFKRITGSSRLPDGFNELFKGGTKPSDWTISPPSKVELIQLLKIQLDDINSTFTGKLDEKLKDPFLIRDTTFETIGDILGFVTIHEVQHSTTSTYILKEIQRLNTNSEINK
ncbi:DinB family protein [Bacillus sp. EAC]|uniref:DinB family protein n=1 Tax=Bacillus sp. EAC TaxID=1978338 RepID=UPI000B44C2DF|nr:DinB family protein [Bacillus sp. EAC]